MSNMRLGCSLRAHTSSDVRPRKCSYSRSSSNSGEISCRRRGGADAVNPAQQRQLRLRLPQSSTQTDVIGPRPKDTLLVCLRAWAFATVYGGRRPRRVVYPLAADNYLIPKPLECPPYTTA